MNLACKRKKLICLGLVLLLLAEALLLAACGGPSSEKTGCERLTAIYIPLDNRPINDDQVRILAESLGIELLMPDIDIYATAINGSLNGSGLQYGDRGELLAWLLKNEKKADVAVIYLDQLLSGGLMNSRCMDAMQDVDVPGVGRMTEYQIIDCLTELSKTCRLYVIDSQLRLAESSGYLDFTAEDYTITRAYGLADRGKPAPGQSLEDVIAGYNVAGGRDAVHAAGLTEAQISYFTAGGDASPLRRYLAIRERKLRLNAYAVEKLCGLENVTYFFGVDDSAAGNTIQSAEYAYLRELSGGKLDKLSAIDCLGELAFSCVFNDYAGGEPVSVKLRYFGASENGKLNFAGHSVSEAAEQIVELCGGVKTDGKADVEILVACDSDSDAETAAASKALAAAMAENEASGQPTIYVDFASKVNRDILSDCNISMLLSAGLHANGSGASAIMGIGQGLARFRALSMENYLTDKNQEAFAKHLLYMFSKGYYWNSAEKNDMAYWLSSAGYDANNMTALDLKELKAVHEQLTARVQASSAPIVENMNGSEFISSLAPYATRRLESVSVESCTFPWMRTFEFKASLNARLE